MKIRSFMIADDVARGEGGKVFIHGGTLTEIEAAAFPHVHPRLAVFATVETDKGDADVTFSVAVLDSDGRPISPPMGGMVDVSTVEDAPLPAQVNLLLTIQGAVFPEPGLYWFALTIDDQEVDRVPLVATAPPDTDAD